jgi:hypothetical protein
MSVALRVREWVNVSFVPADCPDLSAGVRKLGAMAELQRAYPDAVIIGEPVYVCTDLEEWHELHPHWVRCGVLVRFMSATYEAQQTAKALGV